MYGYIYQITNLVNLKVYIGQTKRDPEARWKEYLRGAHDQKLREDMIFFSKDNFKFEVIDTAETREELSNKEKYWIETKESSDPNKGYNRYLGGYGGSPFTWSDESRQSASADRKGSAWMHKDDKQSLVRKENISNYLHDGWEYGMLQGRKHKRHSEATRLKMSQAAKGKPKSAEQIEKQRASLRSQHYHWYTNGEDNLYIPEGETIPAGYTKGRVYSEEICKRISEACQGRTPWNKGISKNNEALISG